MGNRTLRYVPLDSLNGNPQNPKGHDLDLIGESLDRFGYVEPQTMDDRTGLLIAGHGRLEQLRAKQDAGEPPPEGIRLRGGEWQVPVVFGWASADDTEALAYLVASNQSTIAGGWDYPKLGPLLDEVRQTDLALIGTGYTSETLDEILAQIASATDLDLAPAVDTDPADLGAAPARTSIGDVWMLGPHRLAVGDAADASLLSFLMEGTTADVVWTDPPYGVAYVGKTADALTITNDDRADHRAFLGTILQAVTPFVTPGAAFYSAGPPGPLGTEMRLAIIDAHWRFHEALVWVKDQFVLGHSDYHYAHEDILYGWLPGPGRSGRGDHVGSRWRGDNAQTSVFHVPRPQRSTEHPTMKPVELIVPMLLNSSLPGERVLDPFAGSGSTLIACQETGREARLVEIDPRYADVILDRWERHGGSEPVKVDT